jgi:hypothetical protein
MGMNTAMAVLHTYREDGTEVFPGDTVTDFRGETHVFDRATRASEGLRKSGKVMVRNRNTEYYDRVFGLTVTEGE